MAKNSKTFSVSSLTLTPTQAHALEQLEQILLSDGTCNQIINLVGPAGCGKGVLLSKLEYRLSSRKEKVYYLSLQENNKDISRSLVEAKQFLQNTNGDKYLLLDDIDDYLYVITPSNIKDFIRLDIDLSRLKIVVATRRPLSEIEASARISLIPKEFLYMIKTIYLPAPATSASWVAGAAAVSALGILGAFWPVGILAGAAYGAYKLHSKLESKARKSSGAENIPNEQNSSSSNSVDIPLEVLTCLNTLCSPEVRSKYTELLCSYIKSPDKSAATALLFLDKSLPATSISKNEKKQILSFFGPYVVELSIGDQKDIEILISKMLENFAWALFLNELMEKNEQLKEEMAEAGFDPEKYNVRLELPVFLLRTIQTAPVFIGSLMRPSDLRNIFPAVDPEKKLSKEMLLKSAFDSWCIRKGGAL
jgi:hypothetical protein